MNFGFTPMTLKQSSYFSTIDPLLLYAGQFSISNRRLTNFWGSRRAAKKLTVTKQAAQASGYVFTCSRYVRGKTSPAARPKTYTELDRT
jgi:hypothetical protein